MTTTLEHITIDGDRYVQVTVSDYDGVWQCKVFCSLDGAEQYIREVLSAYWREQ